MTGAAHGVDVAKGILNSSTQPSKPDQNVQTSGALSVQQLRDRFEQ